MKRFAVLNRKIIAGALTSAMILGNGIQSQNITNVYAAEQGVGGASFEFNAIGKPQAADVGKITEEGTKVTISPSNGKISSTDDTYPFYNFEVNDNDSFSFEVDMTVLKTNDTGTVSNQSYAGILFRDYVSDVQTDKSPMIGTGVRGVDASTVTSKNFYREGTDTTLIVDDGTATETIGKGKTHKLRLDKFGDIVRVSIDGSQYIDNDIMKSFGVDKDATSNLGVFAARNLVTEFNNATYTTYESGKLIVTAPTKKSYVLGFENEFKTDGMKVSFNGTEVALKDCIITGFDTTTAGTKTITVAYGKDSQQFKVDVIQPTMTSVETVYNPVKDSYYTGQSLDLTGMVVKATYDDNKSYIKTYTYGDAEFTKLFNATEIKADGGSVQKIELTSKSNAKVKTTFNVSVSQKTLSSIEVVAPAKTTYYVGDGKDGKIALDTKGMVVKAVYTGKDGTAKEHVELTNTDLVIGTVDTTQALANQTIPVTYKNVKSSVNVKVLEVAPEYAVLTAYPKTTYEIGEKFDSEGLEVTLGYNNGKKVVLASEDYKVDVSAVNNSKVGSYTASVTLADNYNIANKKVDFKVIYREPFEVKWNSVIFGASTTLNPNDQGVFECVVAPEGNVLDGGKVRVASLNGKGKITGAQDGIAYYYFELDPTKDNFRISADVTVNSYAKNPHDGQESIGIMARDAINTNGDSSVFASNIASVGGYSGGTKLENGIQGFVRSGVDPSNSSAEIVMEVVPVKNMAATAMTGKTYNLVLEKDNTGFLMSFDNNKPVRIYADSNLLNQKTAGKMYVGFYAARVGDITVSNVDLEVSDKSADAPQVVKSTQPIEPSVKVTSLEKFGSDKYNFKFVPNVDGVVKVKQGTKVIAEELKVTAGKEVTIPTTLASGENNFVIEYWADSTKNITTATKVINQSKVNFGKLGENNKVYVSNKGNAKNNGTANNPVDMQTALDYAAAGQTILIEEGTYKFDKALVAPLGVNGTKDKKIVVRPKNDGEVIFDFNKVGDGLRISGDYWHFFKVNVTNSAPNSNAIVISGNNNILESSTAYKNGNTGIQISALSGTAPRETWPTYNKVINCTSYENRDPSANNADGFAAKITTGKGNEFIGCISYANADDGWDLYSKTESGAIEVVTLTNCVAYGNGYIDGKLTGGDMNGFKLGGEGLPVNHTITNSLAFNNGANGFDSNSNPNVIAKNNISYNNEGDNYNLTTYVNITPAFKASNIVSFYSADYTHKNADEYEVNQVPLSNTYNATTYLFNGSKTVNSTGVEFTATDFKALKVPTEIKRSKAVFGSTTSNIIVGDVWSNLEKFFASK